MVLNNLQRHGKNGVTNDPALRRFLAGVAEDDAKIDDDELFWKREQGCQDLCFWQGLLVERQKRERSHGWEERLTKTQKLIPHVEKTTVVK